MALGSGLTDRLRLSIAVGTQAFKLGRSRWFRHVGRGMRVIRIVLSCRTHRALIDAPRVADRTPPIQKDYFGVHFRQNCTTFIVSTIHMDQATDNQTESVPSTRNIVKRGGRFVFDLFKTSLPHTLVYHNYIHTREVVAAARTIAKGMKLGPDDLEIVSLAAWFHDAGYTEAYKGHEEKGADIARAFLGDHGYPQERIERVVGCIMATHMPQHPANLIEEIVCDADLSHVGKTDFVARGELLRLEWKMALDTTFTDLEWATRNLEFIANTSFHTKFAQVEFNDQRVKNLLEVEEMKQGFAEAAAAEEAKNERRRKREAAEEEFRRQREQLELAEQQTKIEGRRRKDELEAEELRTKIDSRRRHEEIEAEEMRVKAEARQRKLEIDELGLNAKIVAAQEKSSTKAVKEKLPERGIETMFRIVSKNHMDLSAMADNKANIMISINALIISILLGTIVSKLDDHQYLVVPTLVLLVVCLSTIILATISTRPKVTAGTFTREDIEQKRANLLFFGNFFNMKIDDFQEGMISMMSDREYLYGSMIRDNYFLGQVLGRKYRYLRVAYNVFMYGLIFAVAVFAVAALFFVSPAN